MCFIGHRSKFAAETTSFAFLHGAGIKSIKFQWMCVIIESVIIFWRHRRWGRWFSSIVVHRKKILDWFVIFEMTSFGVANSEWLVAREPCVIQWVSLLSIRYWVAPNCSTQFVSVWMTGTVFSITCVLNDWNAAIFHIIVISFIPHFLITVKHIRNCSVLTRQWITECGMCGCARRNRTFVACNWLTWWRGRSIQNVLIFQSNRRYKAPF